MISGNIILSKPVAEILPQALFDESLSPHLSSASMLIDGKSTLLVWEKKSGDSLRSKLSKHDTLTDEIIRNEIHGWSLQALFVQLGIKNGNPELIVERNHHAFCPLYFLQNKETVRFHWDPTRLYQYLSGAHILDRSQCEAFLNFRWNYGPDTVFSHIKMIPERGRVVFTALNNVFVLPDSIAAFEPLSLTEGADPLEQFERLLSETLEWWSLQPQNTYSEQSSGLDTTLISILLGKIMPSPPRTFGYYPHDKQIESIVLRREEAIRRIGGQDICPSIESYFSHAFTDQPVKHWPYEAPTSFEKNIIAQNIFRNGGDIIFSGIGGDELCQLSEHEILTARQSFNTKNENSKFVSTSITHDLLKKDSFSEVPSWPVGYVPESSHDVANSIAPAYLRNKLWYAHPLALGHVQIFAHFLPVEWRKDRRLSRDILVRLGFSDFFVKQIPKESVGLSIDKMLLNDDVFNKLFKNSILADEKLIDMRKLLKMRDLVKEQPGQNRASGNLMTAYALERSLKSL